MEAQFLDECSLPEDEIFEEIEMKPILEDCDTYSTEQLELTQNSEQQPSSKMKWGTEETKVLLNMYVALVRCIGPEKRFRTKKLMWTYIAAKLREMFNISANAIQVETRYKCVTKRKKKLLEHATLDSLGEEVPYDEDMPMKIEDPLCSEYVLAPGKYQTKDKIFTQPTPKPSTPTVDFNNSMDGHSSTTSESEPVASGSTEARPEYPVSLHSAPFPAKCRGGNIQEKFFIRFIAQKERHFQEKMKLKEKRERERELLRHKRHKEILKLLRIVMEKNLV